MQRLLAKVRAIVGPFMPEIVKNEPALATAAAGAVTDLAIDVGLHLTAKQSGLLTLVTMGLVGKIVRELVTPEHRGARRPK